MLQPLHYTARQIRLHWVVALIIVLQFVLHEPIADAWEMVEEGQTPASNWLILSHVIGVLWFWSLRCGGWSCASLMAYPPPRLRNPNCCAKPRIGGIWRYMR